MADVILALGGIYQIRNTENGKVYIGSAVNPRTRLSYHVSNLRRAKHVNSKLQRAWHRYGEAAFALSVVEYVPSVFDLVRREQHWIDAMDAVDGGYNIRRIAQSNQGLRCSAETRAKMSASSRRLPMSERTKKALSQANKGINRFSPEQIAQMSIDRKGRTHTDEAKAKIAIASMGRKLSPESIAKRTAATMATVSARGPLAVSAESRARMSASKKGRPAKGRKPVLLFGVEYVSITAAALGIGRNPQWVKARMGTSIMPEGDVHARMRPSAETRKKMSDATKGRPKTAVEIAKRVATRAANRAALLVAK